MASQSLVTRRPPGFAVRSALFDLNVEAVERLVLRARQKTQEDRSPFCVVVIDVDDAFWRPLADFLMPDYDWDAVRATAEPPIVARGVVPRDFMRDLLVEQFDQPRFIAGDLDTGIDVMVFADGGETTFVVDSPISLETT